MSDDKELPKTELGSPEKLNEDANTCLALGAGIGVLGTGAAILTGAVCPVCYIATPVLLGMGVFQKVKARKKGRTSPSSPKK